MFDLIERYDIDRCYLRCSSDKLKWIVLKLGFIDEMLSEHKEFLDIPGYYLVKSEVYGRDQVK